MKTDRTYITLVNKMRDSVIYNRQTGLDWQSKQASEKIPDLYIVCSDVVDYRMTANYLNKR